LETQVLIIGAGVTGTGIARDLALRGVQCLLVEKGDVNAGASGANHGLLHSGARYVSNDPATATECRKEGMLLKALAPHCIEDTGGLFVAVKGDDEKFVADFPGLCSRCGIPVRWMAVQEARELEPEISKDTMAVYHVEDATIDPFMLSLENLYHAKELGATFRPNTRVVGFVVQHRRIQAARLLNTQTREEHQLKVEHVVNAAGPWAGEVAALAGVRMEILYSKGSMVITDHRMNGRVLNRLRRPSNGDILVPGGTVSILGTTSERICSLDNVRPSIEEVDLIVKEGMAMVPPLESARYIRAYAGVRPLVNSNGDREDRAVSRGFVLLDHTSDALENLTTISGGKVTTYRLMAEQASDQVCAKLGVSKPCLTRTQPLPSTHFAQWTQPGLGPRRWFRELRAVSPLLCECEMLPESAIDELIQSLSDQAGSLNLKGIKLRSRMGKGPCQGTFCGMRVTAHMYDRGLLRLNDGISGLKEFLQGRWMGERPVLWGEQLVQAELKEALYCGLMGIELQGRDVSR
jgi:glycerol-3-phosphate dehydrogenase